MSRFPSFPANYRQRWISKGLWLDGTLPQYFDEAAEQAPERAVVVFPDSGGEGARTRPYLDDARDGSHYRITFAKWKQLADDVAAGLLKRGIGFEDIVTVQLPNWPEMCILQIALARIGAVIQPMHMVYRQREMRSMLRFCQSSAIFLPAQYGSFDYAGALEEISGDLPDLRLAVVCGAQNGGCWPTMAKLVEEGRANCPLLAKHLKEHPVTGDTVFYLNFTSGTEGDPKGFLHTHNTLISTIKRFYGNRQGRQVMLANSPMTHSYGHLSTYQLVFSDACLVLIESFHPRQILEIIQREKVTSLSGTPAHLISLIQHPDFPKTDVSSVKSVGVGGAACPPKLIEDIRSVFNVRVGNTYGMGETLAHTMTFPTDSEEKIRNTVGRALPGSEVGIFSDDHTRQLPQGEMGEIAYRGPSLFLAYFRNPEQTAKTRNADGWFFTGDLGYVDGEGYLHLGGRRKDLINRGGTKIFPKEIEDLLVKHPKVAQAAVVGMPDYRLGEKVCAYVVPYPGQSMTLEEVNQFLVDQHVMKYNLPERLEVVKELPMTPTGKVLKRALADDVRGKIESEAATS